MTKKYISQRGFIQVREKKKTGKQLQMTVIELLFFNIRLKNKRNVFSVRVCW